MHKVLLNLRLFHDCHVARPIFQFVCLNVCLNVGKNAVRPVSIVPIMELDFRFVLLYCIAVTIITFGGFALVVIVSIRNQL